MKRSSLFSRTCKFLFYKNIFILLEEEQVAGETALCLNKKREKEFLSQFLINAATHRRLF